MLALLEQWPKPGGKRRPEWGEQAPPKSMAHNDRWATEPDSQISSKDSRSKWEPRSTETAPQGIAAGDKIRGGCRVTSDPGHSHNQDLFPCKLKIPLETHTALACQGVCPTHTLGAMAAKGLHHRCCVPNAINEKSYVKMHPTGLFLTFIKRHNV